MDKRKGLGEIPGKIFYPDFNQPGKRQFWEPTKSGVGDFSLVNLTIKLL